MSTQQQQRSVGRGSGKHIHTKGVNKASPAGSGRGVGRGSTITAAFRVSSSDTQEIGKITSDITKLKGLETDLKLQHAQKAQELAAERSRSIVAQKDVSDLEKKKKANPTATYLDAQILTFTNDLGAINKNLQNLETEVKATEEKLQKVQEQIKSSEEAKASKQQAVEGERREFYENQAHQQAQPQQAEATTTAEAGAPLPLPKPNNTNNSKNNNKNNKVKTNDNKANKKGKVLGTTNNKDNKNNNKPVEDSPLNAEVAACKTILNYLQNVTSVGKPKKQNNKKDKQQQSKKVNNDNKKEEKEEEEKKEEDPKEEEKKEEEEKGPQPITPPFNVYFALEVISMVAPTNTKEAADLIPVVTQRKLYFQDLGDKAMGRVPTSIRKKQEQEAKAKARAEAEAKAKEEKEKAAQAKAEAAAKKKEEAEKLAAERKAKEEEEKTKAEEKEEEFAKVDAEAKEETKTEIEETREEIPAVEEKKEEEPTTEDPKEEAKVEEAKDEEKPGVEEQKEENKESEEAGTALSARSGTLEVTVTGANFKRMDPSAYGVTERVSYISLKVGEQVQETKKISCPTLDPLWEEVLTFQVADSESQKLFTTFFLGDQQIGLPCEFSLNSLKKTKATYKGMPVVGGKVDFLLRAVDFGEEEQAAAEDDFDPFAMM